MPSVHSATEDTELKWYERPMRVLRRDYISQFEQVAELDLEDEARACKEDWHANVEWVMATLGAEGRAYQTTFNTPRFEKLPAHTNEYLMYPYYLRKKQT